MKLYDLLCIILTLTICVFIALGILYNLFGRKPDVSIETGESIIAPMPVEPSQEPMTEWPVQDGYELKG